MNEFERIAAVFDGISCKKKTRALKRKSNQSWSSSGGKRKQNETTRFPSLFQKRKVEDVKPSTSKATEVNQPSIFDSVDKKDILPHLTCDVEDFSSDLELPATPEDETVIKKPLDPALDPDIYSPNIEEFDDDFFFVSQESSLISSLNYEIVKIRNLKPKFKPPKKRIVAGGLLETLRNMKQERLDDAAIFATSKKIDSNQEKIQVVEFTTFRRRLLVRFKFPDHPINVDSLVPDETYFLVLEAEFDKILLKHSYFNVVFDMPRREFQKYQFLYFGKLIKACHSYRVY